MSDILRKLAAQLGGTVPRPPRTYDPNGSVIIAGHESPHKFDQYSLDHMGKGEGAQAFTRGTYLWEDPGVGRHYHNHFKQDGWDKDTFFKPPTDEIKHYNEDGIWADQLQALERLYRDGQLPLEALRYRDLGNIKAAGAELEHWAQRQLVSRYENERKARAWIGSEYGHAYDPVLGARFPGMPSIKEHQRLLQEDEALGLLAGWLNDEYTNFRADDFVNPPGGVPGSPGFTYHTMIHAGRQDLPDLRTPIWKYKGTPLESRLAPALESVLDQIERPLAGTDALRHRDALIKHSSLTNGRYPDPAQATLEDVTDLIHNDQTIAKTLGRDPILKPSGNHHPALGPLESALMDEGIPGVRYKATGGKSPRENFVMYDPKYLEIVKRYPYALFGPLLVNQGEEHP